MFHSSKASVALLLAVTAQGCSDPGPCGALEPGKSYDVEVVERWDRDSVYEPPSQDGALPVPPQCEVNDIAPGEVHVVDISRGPMRRPLGGDDCYEAVCSDDFPTQSEPSTSPYPYQRDECFNGDRSVTIGKCRAQRLVSIRRINYDVGVFDEPKAGERPIVILDRTLAASDSDECADVFPDGSALNGQLQCSDWWVVRIKKR